MGLSERRAEIAAAFTNELTDITVHPYRASSPKPFTGWVQFETIDQESCTWGEVRLNVEVLILVAANRSDFEKVQDQLTPALVSAVSAAGGRAPVIRPYSEVVDSTTLYCLSTTFYTESEAL